MHNFLITLLLSIFSFTGSAWAGTQQRFTPDSNVQQMAEAYAQLAVTHAKAEAGIILDWSDSSIESVEKTLVLIHASFISTKPTLTEEDAMPLAKVFGSYIGEVYRRNHGGTWGIVSIGGQEFPGVQTNSGVQFWPWGRTLNRIMHGSESNVLDYYRALLEK